MGDKTLSQKGGKPVRATRAADAPPPGRRPATVTLDDLAAVLSAGTAEQFFSAATAYLANTLGVAFAFVGAVEPDGRSVRSLSLTVDRQAVDNFRYDLPGTPCESVIATGFCTYESNVQQLFPEDSMLGEMGIDSYCGKALHGADGRAMGVLVVMDRKPLADRERTETFLHLFAGRTGSALVRVLHEQQLRESQRIHATLLSNLPGMVYRCRNDSEWTSDFISDGSLALTGYAPDDFVAGRVSYGSLIHPQDRQMVWDETQAAIGQKRPFKISYRIRAADGREKWVWEQGEGVFGDGGELLSLEGFITDITERRRAEEAVARHNRLIQTVGAIDAMIVRETDQARLLDEACRILVEVGGYRSAWIGMCEKATQVIRPLACSDSLRGYIRELRIRFDDSPEGRGPAGMAVRTNQTQVINDVEQDPGFAPWRHLAASAGYRSLLAIPLRVGQENVTGVVAVHAIPVNAFGDEEVTLLARMADNVGHAMHMLRQDRERERAEQALAQSEQQYRALMLEAADGIFIADSEGNYVNVNPRGCLMVGYREDELRRMNMKDLIPPGDPPPQLDLLRSARSILLERRLRRKDGHLIDVEISASMLEDGRLQSIVRDITQRKRAEAEMLKLSSAVDQTADSVLITDVNGIIEYVNPAFEMNTGYSAGEAVGQTPRLVKSGQHDQAFYEKLWATILAGEVFRAILTNRRKDGSLYFEEKTITPIRNEERRITHFVSTGKDITERMQAQQRLQYLAYHDVLTGLANRTLFLDRLEHALQRAPRTPRSTAVLFLDVDRFKVINDTLGHDVGDRLLRALAERLKSCVREADTVARLSGDEFAVLLEDLSSTDDVVRVARKILQAFANPFDLGERELFVTTSIGVSIYPEDGKNANDLLKSADTAMYRAKEAGRNTYQFYSPDMSARAVERLALETGLRRALERRELVLYYQPIVDMGTRRIVAVEALLRWQQPELGLVQPSEFIGLLEETGMIVPVGEWVIDTVVEQLARWKRAGRSLRVSVNLSARQFINKDFVNQVVSLAQQQRLEPQRLEFEITESILMQNAHDTLDLLNRLDALGCRLAIDDFGTGYSSLSYLKRFPIDVLKIDRSFVRDIPDDKDDASIVSTIVAMAHNLKLTVVAEGVESDKQLTFLRACGCDLMQGTFYSRALPLDELERLLDQDLPLRG